LNFSAESEAATDSGERAALPPGHRAVTAQLPGNVWKINVRPGQRVTRDEPLLILESMKMEIAVHATEAGEVVEVACAEGRPVQSGDTLIVFKPSG
jgi:urea carboxylase